MDPAILNKGLDLAMEFGQNWLRPIQSRLAGLFPRLSKEEFDEYDRICREAMKYGHAKLRVCWREAKADKPQAFQFFRRDIHALYPWVSESNLSQLFSQGCYYAYKDGEL